jgi:integrase
MLALYASPATRKTYRTNLEGLFRAVGKRDPGDLTETELLAWARGDIARVHPSDRGGMAPVARLANNTVRTRVKAIRALLNYCHSHGIAAPDCETSLRRLLRSFPPTYAKVQGRNQPQWLTHDQAFGALIEAVRDGSLAGLRNELIIRFGLCGLRRAEIANLTWSNLHGSEIVLVGKGNQPGRVALGATLLQLLETWHDHYAAHHGAGPTDPIICAIRRAKGRPIRWGSPIPYESVYFPIRDAARKAGLGPVSPHDLRRSAAGILHNSTDESGAHHFDLLDIQKVLRHRDPAITMKCYLDPLDSTARFRAANVLD